jgi:uncharacterized protein (TIGR03437 family)
MQTLFRTLGWALSITATLYAQATYTVTDLGRLGGGYDTTPLAINNLGHVVGEAMDTTGHYLAFFYAGSLQGLGSLGGGNSRANAINSSDRIAGRSTVAGGDTHAFLYDAAAANPQMVDLHTSIGFGGRFSTATAINDAGQIVGTASIANGGNHAFLLTGNTATDLHARVSFGGSNSYGSAITNTGWIAGVSEDASGNPHAFLYNLNTSIVTNLGTLGGPGSAAMALNSAGSVVGIADASADGNTAYAFQTAQQAPLVAGNGLGALGGSYSMALGINTAGQVVGEADDATAAAHAFLYRAGSGMQNLGSLIPANSGWILSYATAINDSGMIVGHGVHGGRSSGFLLTPQIPPPQVNSVVNPASGTGSLSPGVLAAVSGSNLTGANLAVTVGNINCPLVFNSTSQFLFVILPLTLSPGPANLVVSHDGLTSNAFSITLNQYSPVFFTGNGSGSGVVSATTAGAPFQKITEANKANGGDVLSVTLLGLGQTNPAAPPAGTATPLPPPLYNTLATPTMSVGGNSATVQFSGLSPNFASIYQVNFTVPPLSPPGDQPIALTIGGFTTQPLVTLPIGCRDVTSQVTVTRGGYFFNRQLNKFVQSVQVVSNNASLNLANGTLMLVNLSAGATLANTVSSICPPSDGSPNTGLAFGAGSPQTATTALQFSDPSFASISYGVRVLVP